MDNVVTVQADVERRHHMQWTPSDVINLVAISGLLVLATSGMIGVAVLYWHRGSTMSELVMLTNGIATGILGFIGGRALAQVSRPSQPSAVVTGDARTVNVNADGGNTNGVDTDSGKSPGA